MCVCVGGGYVYSLNKKEWICSLFKEWILEKIEIRVNLEWIWSEHLCYSLILEWPQGSLGIPEWSLHVVTPKWVNNTNVHSKFTLISLFSKIHSLKSEHIHSFLFREYSNSGQLYIPLKHLMMLLKYNFFRASFLRLIKDTDSTYRAMQLRCFKGGNIVKLCL